MAPRINTLILIPGAGWSDDTGRFTRGASVDAISESDVVDIYLGPLAEYLDECNVRYEILPTRKHPGVPESARLVLEHPNTVQIDLRCGFTRWDGDRRKHNESTVYYAGAWVKPLAARICEGLGEWGRCTSFGHREGAPREFEGPAGALRILPFCLNGPDAQQYLSRLAVLGKELALSIVDYLCISGECQRSGPIKYPDRTGKQAL
jgi:hypothetical protein